MSHKILLLDCRDDRELGIPVDSCWLVANSKYPLSFFDERRRLHLCDRLQGILTAFVASNTYRMGHHRHQSLLPSIGHDSSYYKLDGFYDSFVDIPFYILDVFRGIFAKLLGVVFYNLLLFVEHVRHYCDTTVGIFLYTRLCAFLDKLFDVDGLFRDWRAIVSDRVRFFCHDFWKNFYDMIFERPRALFLDVARDIYGNFREVAVSLFLRLIEPGRLALRAHSHFRFPGSPFPIAPLANDLDDFGFLKNIRYLISKPMSTINWCRESFIRPTRYSLTLGGVQ
jgi:hypothetical protein